MIQRTAFLFRRVLPRHTTVAAYLALMLASSTAVYAAATIGSADVINNSLKSVDLADGMAVGGVDVINDSLKGADVEEMSLNGVARAVVHRETADDVPGPMKTLASAGGFDLLADCSKVPETGSTYPGVRVRLWVRGPAGEVQRSVSSWTNDQNLATYPGGQVLPAGVATDVLNMTETWTRYRRIIVDLTVASGTSIVKFDLHMLIDYRTTSPSCSIFGTALKAA